MWRLIDRARVGKLPDRLAWLVLGFGMVISFGLAMWFGRHSWYSVDEQVWLSESSDFSLGTAFSDHYGHLVFIPRVLYKLIFATLGTGYLPFRLLSLCAIFLTVALLFVLLKRRLPAFVALAPCLVLLVFPVDPWNYLVGNGFFVLLPVACGLAALICLERRSRVGDLAAFGLLCFGILTCTFVLPFIAGIALFFLLTRENRRRAWIGLLPLAGYALWRVLEGVATTSVANDGTDWVNLFQLPAWSFQALGAILATLAGLNFDLSTHAPYPSGGPAAPALAVLVLVAAAWHLRNTRPSRDLWLFLAILLALFTSQVLVSGEAGRGPAEPRYLYPGAILVVLAGAEILRKVQWSRAGFIGVWTVCIVSLLTGGALLTKNTEWMELWFDQARADITAISLLESTGNPPPVSAQPRLRALPSYSGAGGEAYGLRGWSTADLLNGPAWASEQVDDFLARSQGYWLEPLAAAVRCQVTANETEGELLLPGEGGLIQAAAGGKVKLGRFAPKATVDLGRVRRGHTYRIALIPDRDSTRWFLTGPRLRLCAG